MHSSNSNPKRDRRWREERELDEMKRRRRIRHRRRRTEVLESELARCDITDERRAQLEDLLTRLQ